MKATDVIKNKRDKKSLSTEEINFIIEGFARGEVTDYQMSSLLMAIYLNGMTTKETADLTHAMLNSGKTIDYKKMGFNDTFVDKHSTGGVGDKVSLILYPLVASCGVKVSAMCGRGLGHTGGTIDKMESISGYKTQLKDFEAADIISQCGYVIMSQTDDIAPADKLLYALRDVTGTVESIPLITGSILSKKVAEGSDALVFDVKCGRGAFMKTLDDAKRLSKSLIDTVCAMGKNAAALITNMDVPLGDTIGNFLEVREALESLDGHGQKDTMEVVLSLAEKMLLLSGVAKDKPFASEMAKNAISSGEAKKYFLKNVALQGGDVEKLLNDCKTRRATIVEPLLSKENGFISFDAEELGLATVSLGAGREKKDDKILFNTGLILLKKPGDRVTKGDALLEIHAESSEALTDAKKRLDSAITYSTTPIDKRPLIIERS